jgi:hypothetical protein
MELVCRFSNHLGQCFVSLAKRLAYSPSKVCGKSDKYDNSFCSYLPYGVLTFFLSRTAVVFSEEVLAMLLQVKVSKLPCANHELRTVLRV